MRIMGLDVGSKTVGVAISDPLGFTAQGLEIIQINEEKGEFGFDRLSELVKEYRVGALSRISGSIQGGPFCCGFAEKHEQHKRPSRGSESSLWEAP